jgi:nitrate/nitrite-specific signal transduction histidine kinase
MNIRDFSILSKFRFIFFFILLCMATSYSVVFYFNNKQKNEGALIDVAGRNRMLSQRMAAMALLADNDDADLAQRALEELRKAMILHEQSIHALKYGGLAPGTAEIVLEPSSVLIQPKLAELEEYFSGHKDIISVLLKESRLLSSSDSSTTNGFIRNPVYDAAINKLKQRLINGTLLGLNAELTQLYTLQAAQSKHTFVVVILVLAAINLFILGFAFYYLRSTIAPLAPLTNVIARLAEGELPAELQANNNDDIGKIVNAVNVLSAQLRSATVFARDVGEGKLDTSISMFNGKGELSASLQLMRSNLKHVATDERKRNWATEGLAQFSEILRSNEEPSVLAQNIIRHLVKYLNASQGSVFVSETQDKTTSLHLLACYAFNRKKFLEKTILPGEGLVGQAYLERDTIHLRQVPNDYILITSGLGEANPNCILNVPLMVNNEVEGVIELASFDEFEEYEIAFVQKLSENIASSLASVKTNKRTKQLLDAAQQTAEELRTQEEELRQNMEELAATQEEMGRKEKQYITRINELESRISKTDIEYQSNLN